MIIKIVLQQFYGLAKKKKTVQGTVLNCVLCAWFGTFFDNLIVPQ